MVAMRVGGDWQYFFTRGNVQQSPSSLPLLIFSGEQVQAFQSRELLILPEHVFRHSARP